MRRSFVDRVEYALTARVPCRGPMLFRSCMTVPTISALRRRGISSQEPAPVLSKFSVEKLARWHLDRWLEAKLLCPTRVTPVIERKQLAACATRDKMQRIGKIDP